jgi:hypothetical protein
MNGEGFQVPPDAEPLEFLMAVMRDNTAAQYRHAKLGVAVTTVLNGQDFASLLEKAIERSQGVYEKVITTFTCFQPASDVVNVRFNKPCIPILPASI